MSKRLRAGVRAFAALAISGGVVFAAAGPANAVTPGWEPDPNSIGTVGLYNASGGTVTSGSTNDSPIATYAIGSHAGRTGDTKATLFLCTPQEGVDPSNWSCDQLSASTDYPTSNGGAPTQIANTTLPTVTGQSGDETVGQENASFPNGSSTAGYVNLYELRVYTSGPGQAQGSTYDSTDILVNPTAHTWSRAYTTLTSTTTTLSINKTSPQPAGTHLNLTATVTNNATGTVQFFDGSTALGTPMALPGTSTNNKVTKTNVIPTAGTHTFKAVYSPAIVNAFASSTSGTTSFTITAASADMQANGFVAPTSVVHNANATYTFGAKNNGPNPGNGTVYAALVYPTDGSIVTQPASGCVTGTVFVAPFSANMNYLACIIPAPMASGATASFQATLKFANTGSHTVLDFAHSDTPDPTSTNNSSVKHTNVT